MFIILLPVIVQVEWFSCGVFFSVTEKFGLYLPQSMSRVIPKLAHIPYAETLAQELLQVSWDISDIMLRLM